MRHHFNSYLILACLASTSAHAQAPHWRDASGNPAAETSSMTSRDGFGGSLLITLDDDWKEKWDTPPENKPSFRKADVIPYGKKVYVLTFFANPKTDSANKANIRCDIQITAPTGKIAMSQKDLTCFSGTITGRLYNTYLSDPVIAFSGDPGDPPGRWIVEVSLRDAHRDVALPLKSSFQLR